MKRVVIATSKRKLRPVAVDPFRAEESRGDAVIFEGLGLLCTIVGPIDRLFNS